MTNPDPKIIDIITQRDEKSTKPLVSLEYFPPRSEEGVKTLYLRMERMKQNLSPAFTDVTWGAGGSTADLSLELALQAHRTGHVANLHMTCTNLQPSSGESLEPKQAILKALTAAKEGGIRNIVALRGDPPAGETEWKATEGGFTCALDLVLFIREHFGSEMGISVAGYPEGHPNAISEVADPSTLSPKELARASTFDGKTYCCLETDYRKEMDYLKKKVDAGADFIITQMFFDAEVFKSFVRDCRDWGITCPIVPGIMCINAYAGFIKMSKFCKTRVPDTLAATMESLKEDAAAVKRYGTQYTTELCQSLLDSGMVTVLHFYTLNLEQVVYGVLDALGWSDAALLKSVDETDAAIQVAKGSAWARVGDTVKTPYGTATVLEMHASTAAAKVQFDQWEMAGGQRPVAYLQKNQYHKTL